MRDPEINPEMERICPECRNSNPPGEETCRACGHYIGFEADTEVKGPAAAAESQKTQEADPGTTHSTEEAKCPECEAVGTIINNRCSRCKWTSAVNFTLKWQDERIANVPLSTECPVFIGRVPPVETALAQHIESNHHTVSRMHAELYLNNQSIPCIRDMGSQNGTSINGRRIQKFIPEQLKVGDMVSFSSSLSAQVVQI
jgi:hypothetical protein